MDYLEAGRSAWHAPEAAHPPHPHPQLPQEPEQLCLPWRRLWTPLAMIAAQTAAIMRPMMMFAIGNSSFLRVTAAGGVCRPPWNICALLSRRADGPGAQRTVLILVPAEEQVDEPGQKDQGRHGARAEGDLAQNQAHM